MNVRTVIAAGVIAAAAAAVPVVSAASASAATCKTTNTYTHSVTSTGSQSWTWVKRVSCGTGTYDKWEHRIFQSYTGMHYNEYIYRDEDSGHYWQRTWKDEVSARGVETITVKITTG